MDEDKQCKRALVCERAPVAVGVKVKVEGVVKSCVGIGFKRRIEGAARCGCVVGFLERERPTARRLRIDGFSSQRENVKRKGPSLLRERGCNPM